MSSSSMTETVEGIEVALTTTLPETSELLGVDVRTLQRWEKRGLPAIGRGKRKRHPWPHAAMWARAWNIRQARGDTPRRISMVEAAAWHAMLVAELDLRAEGVTP